jgi:hypothetical protein
MARRTVLKTEAKTADDVRLWIANETGGQVQCVGEPLDCGHYWEFEAWSADGRTVDFSGVRQPCFSVIAISTCGKFARLRDSNHCEFDSPRVLPAFGTKLFGVDLPKTVRLEKGQIITGRLVGQDMLKDVWIVSGPGADVERVTMDSVGPNPRPTASDPDPETLIENKSEEELFNDEMRKLLVTIKSCE